MPETTSTTRPPAGTTGYQSSLSEWSGPYVTNMLGQTQALANMPYQVYQGPMTAWSSPLQNQAFQGISNLQVPGSVSQAAQTAGDVAQAAGKLNYDPTKFTTGVFNTQAAQQYMNPYVQTALNPQLDEARRQSQISRMNDAARLSQSGAYGGSRQAIMESELNRNLMGKMADITAQGYNTAYDKAGQMFTSDQARDLQAQQLGEQSRQFGAQYGLSGLAQQLAGAQAQGQLGLSGLNAQRSIYGDMLGAGQTQRDIEQQGITADYNEFLQQRDYPMKMLQFQQSMLQGLPIAAMNYNTQQPSSLQNLMGTTAGLLELFKSLPK